MRNAGGGCRAADGIRGFRSTYRQVASAGADRICRVDSADAIGGFTRAHVLGGVALPLLAPLASAGLRPPLALLHQIGREDIAVQVALIPGAGGRSVL